MASQVIRLLAGAVLVASVALAAGGAAAAPAGQTGVDSAASPMDYTTPYTTPGTTNWIVPAGTYQCTAEAWGGGGKGANVFLGYTGGAGGGAYSKKNSVPLIAGNTYAVVVGAGSTSSAAGGDSYFVDTATVLAKGGASSTNDVGASGGQASAGVGDTRYSGGTGANGGYAVGGGGGSSAGTGANGNNGSSTTGGAAPAGGGKGGNGNSNGNGSPGSAPGGGGGGCTSWGSATGGSGANGKVVLTCLEEFVAPTGSITINSGAAYTNNPAVTLTLSATDATSGMYQMQFSDDNVTYGAWEAYGTSKAWTLPNPDGAKTVYVHYKDRAGNVSTYSATITLDRVAPTISTTTPANNATCATLNGAVTITWNENVDCATVTNTTVTISPSVTWTKTSCSGSQAVFTPAGQTGTTYTVTAGTAVKDLAGNAMASSGFSYRTPTTFTSTGTGGSWGTAGTWSPSGLPNTACDPVVVANGTTVTVDGNKTIAASVTVNSGGALVLGTNVLSGAGSFTLSSGGTLQIGSADGITGSGATGNIQTTTRTYNAAANYIYNGAAGQVTGDGLTTANNLTVNNAAGLTLSQGATVNGALGLTNGRLTLGANNLTLGPAATVTGTPSAAAMVVTDGAGAVCKKFPDGSTPAGFTYPIGTGTTDYTPATLNFTATTFASGEACANVANTMLNDNPSLYPLYINRNWTVTQSGISGFSCGVTVKYMDADLSASTQPETSLGLWKVDGAVFALVPDTAVNTCSNTLSGTVDGFSQFTGRSMTPLAVEMADFRGATVNGQATLSWETVSEQDNAGFNVYRGATEQGPWVQANGALIPSALPGSSQGQVYRWTDANPLPGATWYLLEDVDVSGNATQHGPVKVGLDAPTAVRIQSFGAQVDWVGLLRQLFGLK